MYDPFSASQANILGEIIAHFEGKEFTFQHSTDGKKTAVIIYSFAKILFKDER
jgi:hypothetical protein